MGFYVLGGYRKAALASNMERVRKRGRETCMPYISSMSVINVGHLLLGRLFADFFD